MCFSQQLQEIPADLRGRVAQKISRYKDKLAGEQLTMPRHVDFVSSLPKVWCCSDFVADSCIANPGLIADIITSGDLFASGSHASYAQQLQQTTVASQQDLLRVLRLFRRREMVRIAWRDLAGWASLDETMANLTSLAEVCTQHALQYLYNSACQQQGTPLKANGEAMNIVVLAMGKLGGGELNFSSDIDLIFAYRQDGVLAGGKQTSYQQFFTSLCQNLITVLDKVTADGFVFRTDMRLRPYGDSGAIVASFAAMEHYYTSQAREWERYALIKGRQIAGDFADGGELGKMLQPFVYRRYLDYGAFAVLADLKRQISQKLQAKTLDNIKLGVGGIREVEFIGQSFQLIRGGQDPSLQCKSILSTLELLADKQLISRQESQQLQAAYRFLRRLENHLQQYQDLQTHDLPTGLGQRQIIAYSLDFADWDALAAHLAAARDAIHAIFSQIFSTDNETPKTIETLIWQGESNSDSENYMQLHFADGRQILQRIASFKQSPSCKRLSTQASRVIDRLLPNIINAASQTQNPDSTLKRLLDLLETVAGRNVYLSLLAENKKALAQLVKLVAASSWIGECLAKYPVLFDELLNAKSLYAPLSRQELDKELQSHLAANSATDEEQLLINLREFKHLNTLRIASADIMRVIKVTVVSDYLTMLAEVIVQKALHSAWQILTAKHGSPPNTSSKRMNFAVLGFGKLGGYEMGYNSDLDLVFINNSACNNEETDGSQPINCAQFYGRLGQRFRHILDTTMLAGICYQTDMRLRPSGASGLAISPINSYEDYLANTAWVWEHQALIRARFVAGDDDLHQQFLAIRQRIICQPRDKNQLLQSIADMRCKMRYSHGPAAKMDLKHCIGGIVDIEFIVQSLVLQYASNQHDLACHTSTIESLKALTQHGYLAASDSTTLVQAYCDYRDYGHRRALQSKNMQIIGDNFASTRQQVASLWQQHFNPNK